MSRVKVTMGLLKGAQQVRGKLIRAEGKALLWVTLGFLAGEIS